MLLEELDLGKSTLIDLIMGLLIPTKGSLYVDGINLHLEKNKIFKKMAFFNWACTSIRLSLK